jgi:hypothetical protein
VARDGIEPPMPAFSGPPTESRKCLKSLDPTKVELTSSLFQADVGSFKLFAAFRCSRIVREPRFYKLKDKSNVLEE